MDTRFGQIHYREIGSGEPVVFVHGARWDSNFWMRVMPLLADRYRSVALDWPPHGLSDPPPEEPEHLSYYSDNVLAFMDAIGVTRASLVGSHTGAAIVVDIAASHPERVDRLVLYGFPARVENPQPPSTGLRV